MVEEQQTQNQARHFYSQGQDFFPYLKGLHHEFKIKIFDKNG